MHFRLVTIIASLMVIASFANPAVAQQEQILFDFANADVGGLQAGVVLNGRGDIFGTAPQGVYELIPDNSGALRERTLYTVPLLAIGEGVPALDSAGNIYAVRTGGQTDDGEVLELSPAAGGAWTTNSLYTFPMSGKRGHHPYAGVAFDAQGNLYGTTAYGGAYSDSNDATGGTVYELTPQAGGGWTQKVLHSFGNGQDGFYPFCRLTLDSAGNLYGVTDSGGIYGGGTLFELMPNGNGGWKEKIVHNFGNGPDGAQPRGTLTFDSGGNLYGTTDGGGIHGGGTAFELSPQTGGVWKEKILHHFGSAPDGSYVSSNLVFDRVGALYGSTFFGGTFGGGTIFKLSPHANGAWSSSIIYNFGSGSDANEPLGDLTFDHAGNLIGTTQGGGTDNAGVVWSITP